MSTYKVKFKMTVEAEGYLEVEGDNVAEVKAFVEEETDKDELEKTAIDNGSLVSEVEVLEVAEVLLKREAS